MLSGFIGRKASAGYLISLKLKAVGSNHSLLWKLSNLSAEGESGIPCVAQMRIYMNTGGESSLRLHLTLRPESVGSEQD